MSRIALCLAVGAWAGEARAFDFFGLFGSEKPPEATSDALPYELEFDAGDDSSLKSALQDASSLYRLRKDAPPDGETLVRRAEADLPPMIDALWSRGYYDATIRIEIAGEPIELVSGSQPAAAARAAEAHRARSAVPVKVVADPGRQFVLRDIAVVDPAGRPFSPEELPPRVVKLAPGEPAATPTLTAADARIVDRFRALSHPLAKSVDIKPVVDHAAGTMDVTFVVDPGPLAGIGGVSVSGTQNVPEEVVRSFIYLEPGDPYSPKALADTRASVANIPAIGSVRVRQADALDADGYIPIFVDVTERKPRVIGAAVRYSTLDGPELHGYWEHRNLFGGAEQLRLETNLFLLPRNDGTRREGFDDIEWTDFGGRFKASFMKPALGGSRVDLLLDGLAERNRTGGDRYGGYTVRDVAASAQLRQRFTDTFSIQGGVRVERGQTSDVLGKVDYLIVGTPLSVRYDSTDNPTDATRGVKVTATVTPYPTFLGSDVGFTEAKAQASAYYAVDEEARIVLAGRIGLGAMSGSALADIPANHRFYAGGGGSVRGYRYQSLGPQGPFGFVVGGRSLAELSFEARIKITESIGIVPFIDAGNAFASTLPDFKEGMQASAGLGLRYYTPIGPIRVDVAAPLNPRPGDKPVALYIGIGQSF